jgi:hypothetical protein
VAAGNQKGGSERVRAMALCPCCRRHNDREDVEDTDKQPPRAPRLCEHKVFEAREGQKPNGFDYVKEVLKIDLYIRTPPGIFRTNFPPEILEILKKHNFRFEDDMAFVCSDADKEAAQKAVSAYLQGLGYVVPPA